MHCLKLHQVVVSQNEELQISCQKESRRASPLCRCVHQSQLNAMTTGLCDECHGAPHLHLADSSYDRI